MTYLGRLFWSWKVENSKILKSEIGRISGERLHSKTLRYGTQENENETRFTEVHSIQYDRLKKQKGQYDFGQHTGGLALDISGIMFVFIYTPAL